MFFFIFLFRWLVVQNRTVTKRFVRSKPNPRESGLKINTLVAYRRVGRREAVDSTTVGKTTLRKDTQYTLVYDQNL